MPNKPAAVKSLRQNQKRRDFNRQMKSRMKTAIKNIEVAISEHKTEQIKQDLQKTVSVIDRTAQKGIIHEKKAARLISRLTRQVNKADKNQSPSS